MNEHYRTRAERRPKQRFEAGGFARANGERVTLDREVMDHLLDAATIEEYRSRVAALGLTIIPRGWVKR